ncbi:MFS transporter [Gymnodinialimonas sp. 2305UL16-5]|uniref:MFS transporter n=1 Tax=Gymnodinialimonas mytili TaxID=3126503 RepID=UPI003097D57C
MTVHHDTEVKSPHGKVASSARAGAREWLGLALLALPTILLGLDLTFLPMTLPTLAIDLQPTSTQSLWIIDASGFMLGGFLITMGTLGDRIGRRKLLMIGAACFAAASTLAAFSTSAEVLIAARAMLGVAAATLMPSTLALISTLFINPRERALAFGLWATIFGVGYALGPVLGGYLLGQFWWGATFLFAVPIVALLLILAPFLLPEYRTPKAGRLDLFSVAISLAAMLPVIYGVKQIAAYGLSPHAVGPAVVGILFAMLFVWRQRRLSDPLLDISLFRNRAFSVALIVLLVGLVAVGGTMLLSAQYLQLVAGYAPFAAGLWMGLAALGMITGGVGAPLVARSVRPGFVVAGSLVLSAAGYVMLAVVTDGGVSVALVVSGLSLAYLGNGVIAALGTDLVVGAAPAEKAGSASAMSETVQDIGVSIGIAILGSLATAIYRRTMHDHIPDTLGDTMRVAVSDSLWTASAMAPDLPTELIDQAQAAFTLGFNGAALASAISILVIAILAAVALRHGKPLGPSDCKH